MHLFILSKHWIEHCFFHSFAKFQELIAVQTGVSAAQQKLMFKYEEFRPDPMAPASSYPNTSVSVIRLFYSKVPLVLPQ